MTDVVGALAKELLFGLDEQQSHAVSSPCNALCVFAGAGSGKTRVLTRRVAYRILQGSAEAQHTLVLTFTRKAAGELQARIADLGIDDSITAGTFHAIAYAQLRRRWLEQGRMVPQVTTRSLRLLENAINAMRMTRSVNPHVIASEISWAKGQCLTPEDYEFGLQQLRRRPPMSAPQFVRIYSAYEAEKRKRRVLDFDDLLLLMIQALEQDRLFARSQRWLFRHFFVDEFQDMNRAQFELLRLWLGGRDDVFVVGDANQAIYGWNGADASFLENIQQLFPNIETITLNTNYRSSPNVLRAAQSILPDAQARWSENFTGTNVVPRVVGCENETEEAALIARELRSAHSRGHRWNDMAVLVRTNAQRAIIEAKLGAFNIPFQSNRSEEDFQKALQYLRESLNIPLAQRVADLEEMLREGNQAVAELIKQAHDVIANDPFITIKDFLSWFEVASRYDGTGSGSGVTVSTFHRSKGLEWAFVVLAGAEDGIVPLKGQSMDEERRLFYVAVTRSQSELLCTWAARRTNRKAEVIEQKPSPWLEAIAKSASGFEDEVTSAPVSIDAINSSRQILHLETVEITMKEAIVRWRTARVKLTGIDAQFILSDDVIDAIVASRPTTFEELIDCGLSEVRAASIGDQILQLIKQESLQ